MSSVRKEETRCDKGGRVVLRTPIDVCIFKIIGEGEGFERGGVPTPAAGAALQMQVMPVAA